MRISDWSSDVCSSDLPAVEIAWRKPGLGGQPLQPRRGFGRFDQGDGAGDSGPGGILIVRAAPQAGAQPVRPCAFGVGVEADVFRPWTACGAGGTAIDAGRHDACEERSDEHTSELQSLMRISYAVFCLK